MRRFTALLLAAVPVPPAAAQPPQVPAPAAPDPAQAALGRRLAEAGDLNALLGAVGGAEIEGMAANTPGLSDAERTRLRQLGGEVLASGRARVVGALGEAYARHFTRAQLEQILAFLESPAGRAYVGALPHILPQIATTIQGVDLGRDVRAAFCRETGKLCEGH